MKRQYYHTGTTWEDKAGYSRAVRVGNTIEVAGTTAVLDRVIQAPGDAARQLEVVIKIMDEAIGQLGGSLADVVRTRMFLTDISQAEAVMEVHGRYFKDIRPAAALVGVTALVHPDLVIEVEMTAILLQEKD